MVKKKRNSFLTHPHRLIQEERKRRKEDEEEKRKTGRRKEEKEERGRKKGGKMNKKEENEETGRRKDDKEGGGRIKEENEERRRRRRRQKPLTPHPHTLTILSKMSLWWMWMVMRVSYFVLCTGSRSRVVWLMSRLSRSRKRLFISGMTRRSARACVRAISESRVQIIWRPRIPTWSEREVRLGQEFLKVNFDEKGFNH